MSDIKVFLEKVEKNLLDLDADTRAQILSEIETQAQSNPNITKLKPEFLANERRALKGYRNPRSTKNFGIASFFLKSCLSLFIIFALLIAFVVWKFTPILKIDEESEHFSLLGGLIEIDGKAGKIKLIDQYYFEDAKFNNKFQGELKATNQKVHFNFNSGKIVLRTSADEKVHIDCKLSSQIKAQMLQEIPATKIDLTEIETSSCVLKLPAQSQLIIKGVNASIDIKEPLFNITGDIKNGKLDITPSASSTYDYQLEVLKGMKSNFDNLDANGEFTIKFTVENGMIQVND